MGVAITVDGRYKHLVVGERAINDRMAVVGIDAAPSSNIGVIQAYAPTDEEIEEFCRVLEETLASLPRSNIKLVLGDIEAKVGKTNSIVQTI